MEAKLMRSRRNDLFSDPQGGQPLDTPKAGIREHLYDEVGGRKYVRRVISDGIGGSRLSRGVFHARILTGDV
jgi:hypothetical protein